METYDTTYVLVYFELFFNVFWYKILNSSKFWSLGEVALHEGFSDT
jgi:hypothetical protein